MSIPVVTIKEENLCSCDSQVTALIKESKKTDDVQCLNKAVLLTRETKHEAEQLFIEYKWKDGKSYKRIQFFFSYCPFCGKKLHKQ